MGTVDAIGWRAGYSETGKVLGEVAGDGDGLAVGCLEGSRFVSAKGEKNVIVFHQNKLRFEVGFEP